MRKDFYVFRHGETDLNKMNCWQGSGIDYDLNETGVFQGERLARKLKDKNLQVIFSSPLKRAKHTADIVGGYLDIPIIVEKDLRECFYGDAEGRPIEEFASYVDDWKNPEKMDASLPNGENKGEALQRVLNVIERLKDWPQQVMGVAIHRGTMFNLLNYYHFKFDDIPNCGVFHLVYEDGKWNVEGTLF